MIRSPLKILRMHKKLSREMLQKASTDITFGSTASSHGTGATLRCHFSHQIATPWFGSKQGLLADVGSALNRAMLEQGSEICHFLWPTAWQCLMQICWNHVLVCIEYAEGLPANHLAEVVFELLESVMSWKDWNLRAEAMCVVHALLEAIMMDDEAFARACHKITSMRRTRPAVPYYECRWVAERKSWHFGQLVLVSRREASSSAKQTAGERGWGGATRHHCLKRGEKVELIDAPPLFGGRCWAGCEALRNTDTQMSMKPASEHDCTLEAQHEWNSSQEAGTRWFAEREQSAEVKKAN